MGDLLVRWYGRSPFGYVVGIFGLLLLGQVVIAAISVALYCRLLGLSGDVYGTMTAFTVLAVVLVVGAYTWLTVRRELLFGWVRRSIAPQRAPEVWDGLIGMPLRLVVLIPTLMLACVGPVLLILADLVVHADILETVDLMLGAVIATGGMSMLALSGLELLLRPIRLELDPLLPLDFVPARGRVGIRVWLPLEVLAIASYSGILTADILLPAGAGAEALLLALLGSVAISAPVALVFGGFAALRVLTPISELLTGTRRVGEGNLDARVPLTTSDEHLILANDFNRMTAGLRQRESLFSAVGSYIDPAIAERVAQGGSQIPGEAAEVTVMFVDIVGFTKLAEGADPSDVVTDLNDFFDIVIPAIEREGGHANKLLGDGLMAVFGVPNPLADHADRALAAARTIQAGLADRYEGALRAGIGLNSGAVVVGSMGGGGKLDYTIIGDAVNVAARVEAYTRQTGDGILLTDTTKAGLSDSEGLQSRGSQELKGRAGSVGLWAPQTS